jgi:putative membrane protein
MGPHDDAMNEDATRHELAERRTRRSKRRTLLAKERTFAAWVRTGLSAVAVGLGAAQLLTNLEPRWLVVAASSVLVFAGLMALGFGFWSFRDTIDELRDRGVHGVPPGLVAAFTALLVLAGVAGLVLVVTN